MQKMKTISKSSVFAALIIFSISWFWSQKSFGFPLSIEEERVMGEKFLIEVSRQFKFIDDPFANQYINDLGHYLIRPLETKPFPFRFYIIKDNRLNAFAAPGGHIFIFSGLMEAADMVDELAAVICHEIAHVSARHLAQRIDQNKKIGLGTMAAVLAGTLIGGKAGGAVVTGSVAAGIQTQLHFSRNDERQADQLGFKYMNAAGFDPSSMVSVLNKIQKNQWHGTDRVPSYLLTHPTGPERMANLDTMLSGHTVKIQSGEAVQFRNQFPFVKVIMIAKYWSPSDSERFFKSELEKKPDAVSAHLGLGIVLKGQSDYEPAIDHFKKAIKENPDSLPILRFLGETLILNNQNEEGVKILEKVFKQDPQDKSTLLLIADSYKDLEQYEKAVPFYKKLISMEPVPNEVFHNLGVSYGRLDKLSMAHYYFGIYFIRTGKRDKALFHLRKAEDLSENDPALRSQIRRATEELIKR